VTQSLRWFNVKFEPTVFNNGFAAAGFSCQATELAS